MSAVAKPLDDESLGDPRANVTIFKQRWSPVTWKPIYESIVALSAAGKSNIALGEMFDYTPQHICNILKTPEAGRIFTKISETMRVNTMQTLPKRLERLTLASVEIAEDILITRREEFLAETPFKLLDRSLTVLRGVGKLNGDVPHTEINNTTFFVSNTHQKQLNDGLDKLREVWKLHGGPDPEVAKALHAADEADV